MAAAVFRNVFSPRGIAEWLIGELSAADQWKREGYGHWKDATATTNDAPFRAAELLETIQQLAVKK